MYPIGLLPTPGTPDFPVEVILECSRAETEDGTTMFVILWEFEVKPVNLVGFEKAYGPAGAWVQLFQRDSHFRGTQLLHDPSRDSWYFTVDCWDSEADYLNFLAANRSNYEKLDGLLEGLTLSERFIVSFNLSRGRVTGS